MKTVGPLSSLLFLSFSCVSLLAQGSLIPTAPPGPTMKSLQEIWDRIGVLETANAQLAQHLTAQTNILNSLAEANGLLGWRISTVTSAGDVGEFASLAITPDGHPAISYLNVDAGEVRYAVFNGTSWATSTVTGASSTTGKTSLAFTAGGQPAICYYNDALDDLYYASYDGSVWTIDLVDSTGDVGRESSLVFAPNGQPAVAYSDTTNANLKYAIRTPGGWQRVTVDSVGSVGQRPSMAFGPNGQPSISYQDQTNSSLKYAVFNGGWTTSTVEGAGSGSSSALIFTPLGLPAIAYTRFFAFEIKFAVFNGFDWELSLIDTGYDPTSLTIGLTPGGQPAISYIMSTDPVMSGGEYLKYTVFNGTSWTVSIVQFNVSSPFSHAALGFPVHGQPVIAVHQGNDLKVATRQVFPTP